MLKRYLKGVYVLLILAIGALVMHYYIYESGSQLTTRGTDTTKQLLFFKYFLYELFRDGSFFWSWSYGLGGDIFGQFNYYYSMSPFFWLTLLFDIDNLIDIAGWNYKLSLIKHFIAMLSMYVLLRYLKCSSTSSLVSALIYGGNFLFAFNSLQFDFMMEPFIWLPLLVLSFEIFVEKGKWWPFILMVALIVASNFYYGFISSVYIISYAIYKYFDKEGSRSVKDFLKYGFKCAYVYLLGLGIASFAFLPAIYQFLKTDRLQKEYIVPLVFEWEHYRDSLFYLFFPYRSVVKATYSVGLSLLVFILILIGISLRKKNLIPKKIFLGTYLVFFFVPFIYSFFNGLSAMQPRWLYLLSFTVCFVSPFFFDEAVKRENKKLGLIIIGSSFLVVYTWWLGREKIKELMVNDYVNLGLGILSILLFIFYIRTRKWIWSVLLVISIMITGAVQHYIYYDLALGDAKIQKDANRTYLSNISFDNEEAKNIIQEIQKRDAGFYRVIWDHPNVEFNTPMYYQFNGNSAYQSLISSNVHQFFKEKYNILQFDSMSLFKEYDNRIYLETATANKYYITKKAPEHIPYGYEKLWETKNWEVYLNKNYLPIGFVYDKWVTIEDFQKLNTAEKDQLLLQAAVIKDQDVEIGERAETTQLNTQLLFQGLKDVKLKHINRNENNIIRVLDSELSEIQIPIDTPEDFGELLVEIAIENTEGNNFNLTLNDKTLNKRPNSLPWSYPKSNFIINTGWENKENLLRIGLTEGEYRLKDIKVYFNSYQALEEKVDTLKSKSIKGIEYDNQSLSGHIEVEKEGIFFLSVPYSSGWKIKLNGEEVKFYEVNHAFIGFPLEQGEYMLEMEYRSPYFKEGLIITIFTITLAFISSYYLKRRRLGLDE
ncbi:YfhO family protein [Robertmurraya kyonggiensis]|uniref:Membrane protein YfhO n=1 Tax=Robertmurraya kyonggiensis TaxID=1037680 RepID=A0A4U1D5A0_9BACI|nr:YfhO family protein [Robertmurraya kyonggiensis]TKC16978.1 hypothetical protein FA727_13020 [Robertmurraya kyonggiensis]